MKVIISGKVKEKMNWNFQEIFCIKLINIDEKYKNKVEIFWNNLKITIMISIYQRLIILIHKKEPKTKTIT